MEIKTRLGVNEIVDHRVAIKATARTLAKGEGREQYTKQDGGLRWEQGVLEDAARKGA